ncbi:beta-1,3-glucanase family protein [Luteimicrobium album]|uniref:beta-1,3-glucanase family protein n=1 Tax=Luteimicrobium album TaxID=1054550 RepID=UPI0024E09D1F|nr:beta-1,3-glucanase family protein [Luteimicrobium album]
MTAALGAAALLAGALVGLAPAHAAPSTIPFTITNDSGRGDAVYVYVLGHQLSAPDVDGWFDASGHFTPWGDAGPTPVRIDDSAVRIAGPANRQSKTITLAQMSGRIYFSYGQPLHLFKVNNSKFVQPSLDNPQDENANVDFNWSELTFDAGGLWINSTQVDMFGSPYQVGAKDGAGTIHSEGRLKTDGFQHVVDAVRSAGWNASVVESGGSVLRVLSPGHSLSRGLSGSLLDSSINDAWSYYTSHDLVFVPYEDQPSNQFVGRVGGDGVMHVRDGAGNEVSAIAKPSTSDALLCNGALADHNAVDGVIKRTICADLHRSVLSNPGTHPITNVDAFYQANPTNLYSKAIHAQMVDAKAYGFPYDDVTHQESLVHQPDVTAAYMQLDPRTGSAPALGESGGGTDPGDGGTTDPGSGGLPVGSGAITSVGHNLCVDVPWANPADSTQVQIASCSGNGAQTWSRGSDGTVRALGACLDVRGSGTADGTVVQVYHCNGTGAQQWVYDAGSQALRNPQSGKCLDVPNGQFNDGQLLRLWTCNASAAQRWALG